MVNIINAIRVPKNLTAVLEFLKVDKEANINIVKFFAPYTTTVKIAAIKRLFPGKNCSKIKRQFPSL